MRSSKNSTLVTPHSEFYQTRKKQITKILKGFKDQRLIENFEFSNSIRGTNIICFNIYIYNHLESIKVNLSKSNYESWLKTTTQFSSKLDIIIGDKKTLKNLKTHLHEYIVKRVFGVFIENKFLKQIEKTSDLGLSFEKTTIEDDRKGVDFWVYFKGWKIPLQIKTSHNSQIEHMKKFPKIPSIIYLNKKYSDSDLYVAIFDICLEYQKGNILHINQLNKQNSPNY